MAKHLYLRGGTFQFRLRVPSDLAERYPSPVIRTSLKTSDPQEAVKLAGQLHAQHQASFVAMRANAFLVPTLVVKSAQALADSLPPLDADTSYFEDRYQAYVKAKGIPADVLEQNPDMVKEGQYLTLMEQRALAILRTPEDVQGQPRLSDALAIYLATHQNTANKRATDRAARDWGHLVSLAGDIPVLALVREHARSYVVQGLAKGSKTATVRRAVNTVNAVLNVAIRELDIKGANNPFGAVLIPNEGRDTKDVKTPSARELRAVLEAHRDDRSTPALLIRLQLATGARIAEVAGLGVGDVVLSGDTPYMKIQERPWRPLKTATSVRNVPLVGDALEADHFLQEHRTV